MRMWNDKRQKLYIYTKVLSLVPSFWKSNSPIFCAPESVDARLFDVFRAAAQMPQVLAMLDVISLAVLGTQRKHRL